MEISSQLSALSLVTSRSHDISHWNCFPPKFLSGVSWQHCIVTSKCWPTTAVTCTAGFNEFSGFNEFTLVFLQKTKGYVPLLFLRFQRCAKYEDSTACHSSFLEFSYTVWNLTRTGLFVVMCWTLDCHAWIPPWRDFTSIVERCLALHNKTYSQLLLFAAGLPLLMNGHCLSQTVHNILCTASLLLFMVTLNGYHSRTALMTYCALCCVAMNVQSLLVAVFNIYRNLQTQKNGYMATLLYIMQLYLMFLVIMDSCTRVMSKVKNPKQDILGEDV